MLIVLLKNDTMHWDSSHNDSGLDCNRLDNSTHFEPSVSLLVEQGAFGLLGVKGARSHNTSPVSKQNLLCLTRVPRIKSMVRFNAVYLIHNTKDGMVDFTEARN